MPEYIIKNAKGKEKRFSFPTAEEASDYLAVANEDGLEVDQVVFDTDNSEKRFRVTSFNVDDNGITRATAKGSEGFLSERNPFANVGYGVGQTPMSEAYTEAYSRGAQPSVVENPDRSATIIGNSPKEGETIRVNPDRINRTIEATSDYSQRVGDYLEGKTDVETMAKGATDYAKSMMGGPRLTPEESARIAEDPEYGQVYWNIRHKYGITPEEYEGRQKENINARIDDALAVAEGLRNEAIADQSNWVIDIHGNRYNATDDQLKATIRAIKAVKRDLNASRTKYGEKDGWHFGKRFWDRGELIVKLTPALNMIRSLESAGVTFAQANAANKMIADPESLTPEQKLLHSLTAIQQSVAQVQEDLGGKHWASGAGEVISEMPEFMMGMPLAKGATKAVTKGATKVLSKVAGKALKETAENATEAAVKTALSKATGWQKVGRAVGAWGKSFGESVIGAPTQTLLYRSLADEALGQYQVRPDGSTIQVITPAWERVYRAWLSTALELHSEDMGMWIGKGLNALGRRMANVGFVRGLMRVPASRSPLLEAVRKELKVADPISEALGEVYGDAIQPLFTGELDWSETLADPDYWLTTVVASAGVSVAMDIPNGIQYVRDGKRINQLGLIMDVSLESIESDDLRKQVIAATSHNSVARQAEALAHIDWSNATREDIAVAMDYVNAYVQREMYYNSWLEMERQEELSREFNNMLATAYRGVSGFDNAMTTIRATAAKGSSLPNGAEYFIISGDVNNPDGFVSVMRIDNGVPTRDFVPVNQLVIGEEQDISTQLAKAYDELFSEQIAGEEVSSISRAIARMRSEGVAEETIREIVSENPSYHEYKEGGVVTDTQTGEAVTINEQTSTGEYIATKANGQRITISYNEIADSGAYAQQAQAESDAVEEGETINFLDADGNTIEGEVSRVHEDGRVDVMVQAGEENGAPAYVGYTILPSQIIRNSEMPAQPTPTEQVAQDVASDVAAVAETTETPQVTAPQTEVAPVPDAREIPTLEDGSIDYDAIEDPQQFIDLYGKDMTTEELIADVTSFRDDATANTERLNNEVANAKTPNEKKALRDQAKIEANRANKYQAVLDLLMPKAPVAEQTEVAPEVTPVAEEAVEPVAEVAEQTPIAEEQMEVVAEQPTEVVAEQTDEETPIKEQAESPVEEAKPTTTAKPKLDISEKENKRRIPLRRRANLWSRKVGVKVVLLESIDEVESKEAQSAIREAEKNNQKVSGWVDEGKVYLYLPHVDNTDEIDATYIHEVVAHIGMEEMMGEKEYQQFCLKVWDMMNEEERDYYYNYEGVRDNKNEEKRKARAADEYIAHLAEQTNLEERDATMWEKIVDLFAEIFAKLGLPKNITRLNIEDAIRESYRNLVESNAIIEDQSGAVSRLANKGAVVDAKRGDVKFAVRDILKGEEREQAIKDLMRVTGRNRATVETYLQAEESLAAIILDDHNKAFLDVPSDDSIHSIWDDSDYPQGTVEFSNICRKRLPFTMIYQQLQGEFPNTVFDAATLETIRGILKNNGFDVACGLCYVEDRRQHLGEIGQGFIDALKGKTVKLNKKQQKAIEELRASGDTYVPTLEELLTLEGMRRLKRNHYGVAVAFIKYNNARGQQAGRLFEAYSAYHREILKWSKAKVDKANRLGGLRIFSYSDFEAHHLIDIIQVLTDCAVKGVRVQAYTKVPEFALVVKDTRMKLNRSLIAKAKGVVDENYIPQENEAVSPNVINGKRLLFDCVEGINVNSENFFDSTSSPTVGNILVGINDEQIHQAMLDPMVDYIIPFHTGIKGEILEQKGIGDWVNYKLSQTEKEVGKNGNLKTAEEQINVYTEVYSDNIRTEKEFVERYLEVCREKGYTPKFSQFLNKNDKGEFVYTKGYYKFLVDFKLFDVDGNILPQEVVVPLFSNEVNKRILDEYVEGEKTKAPTDKVYNEVKEKLREQGTIRYRFIGEKGAANLDKAEEATIRLNNLNTARQMEEAQKSPKTIKMATGWERGADGKWRYEVEDLNIADPTTWVNSRKRLTLEDIIGKNDPLFSEYPNLRTIAIKKSRSYNMGGSYNHADKVIMVDVGIIRRGVEIKANPTNFNIGNERIEKIWNDIVRELRGTFVHEIQHAIQRIEGFAVGGNPNMYNPNIPFEEVQKRYAEMAEENNKLIRQYNSLSTYERTLPSGIKLRDVIMKGKRQLDKYLKSIRLGVEGYKRLAGEVEARNVQHRMDIPLADRYASLASETADVASEDQIILYNAETSEKVYSIGDNEQTQTLNAKQKNPSQEEVIDERDIQFRISKNNRTTINGWMNKRSDLTEADKGAFLDYIDDLDSKTQLATGKWFANGVIRVPEDMPKVEQAIKVATIAKVDPLQYKSPMELIDRHADIKVKEKPIDPDTVDTLFDRHEVGSTGIVTYEVEESEESRENMRKIINTHFGEEASPWCLLQGDGKGNLTQQSRQYWGYYNAYPKRVAFKDGKLIAFSANNRKDVLWWDRQDQPHKGIPTIGRVPNDEMGRSATIEYDSKGYVMKMTDIHRGNQQNGVYERWSNDLQNLLSKTHYKDGRKDGVEETYYGNGKVHIRQTYKGGVLEGMKEEYSHRGKLISLTGYKNDKMNGESIIYHSDGSYIKSNYKDNKQDGVEEGFNRKGQVEYHIDYKDGKIDGVEQTNYENGQPRVRKYYKNGIQDGLAEMWYENGNRWMRQEWANGERNGISEFWYKNGNIGSRRKYVDGNMIGMQEGWYENGQLKSRTNLKRGRVPEMNFYGAVLDGEQGAWAENGVQTLLENYKDNKRDGLREVRRDDGTLVARQHYKNDKWEGLQELWNNDGTQSMKAIYKDGDFVKDLLEEETNPQESEGGIRFRAVTDPKKVAELENGEKITTYRAMVQIDGKLYPPMSTKVNGKLREPSELGVWEEAMENPDGAVQKANGKWYFNLKKDNGKETRGVAYNPYFHSSTTMLNDQFKEAQDRENLVIVKMEVPKNELTSGYKAEKAHDAVGEKDWKAGTIQGQLTGTRKVILSRWAKPVEIVDVKEVAEHIKKLIDGQVEYMPTNVVTPAQREALEEIGVKFVKTDNREIIQEGEHKGEQYSRIYGAKAKKGDTRFRITPAMDKAYMDAVERGDMETAQRMVDEVAKKAGYDSPILYSGTDSFGFTVIDANQSDDKISFWATDDEDVAGTYTMRKSVTELRESVNDEDIEDALEELNEKINDAISDFRHLIDRTFSEWYFGQQDNQILRETFDLANSAIGEGDGIYDKFIDIVYDAYYGHKDMLDDPYEDADDWLENSESAQRIVDAITNLEGLKTAEESLWTAPSGGIMKLYASAEGMYEIDCKGANWNNLRPDELPERVRPYKTREVVKWAEEKGWNGVVFKNVRDSGAYGTAGVSNVYAFIKPFAQVKSADSVTYDDNGNVIPLSQRFNSRESDIRFRKASATANRNAYNLIRKKLQNAGVKVHEVSEEMVDGAVPLQTPDGTIYGWAVGGEIYLTPQGLNANTAIHEYSHLWVEAMRNMDSRQWSGIKEQLKATPFWQQVLDDPNYENIREDEDAVASEVLARLSGNKGAERLANEAQRIIDAGNGNIMARIESTALVQRVKRLLRDFYAWVARNVFGLTNETTISRVADMVVDDLVNEVHLDNIINSPLEAMFIGENGALNLDIAERVANRVNGLDVAIQMSRDMRSSAEIKLATGWEQGADGAWRYEISDKDVHLNMEAMSELNTIFDKNEYRQRNAERIRMFEESRPYLAEKRRDLIEKYSEKSSIVEAFDDLYGLTPVVAEFKLRDLIDYDEAFDAYPKLGDINVRIIEGMDAQGEHWEGNINLSIETSRIPVRMRAVLLHEIQHAIQGYEGFAVGGSVDSAKKIIDKLERDAQIYEFAQKIKREMERFPESSVSDASLDVVNDMVIAAGKNEEDLIAEGRLDPSIIPFAEHAVNNPAEMERVRDSYNILFTLLGEDGTPIPYKAYEQLMGEVEARNTMTRRNMSAEERAKSLAMYTEDVSRENQILRYRKVYYDAEGNPVKASPISAPKKKLEKRPFRPDSKAGRAFDALWRAFADSQTIVGEYVDGLLQKIGEKEIQRRQQKAGFGFTKREMESLPARIRNKFRNANPIKAYNKLSKSDQILVAKVLSKFNPLIDYMSVQNRSESRGEYEMRSYIENHINPLNEARQRLRDVMGVNDLELEAYVSGEHSLERHKSGIDALSVDEEREWSVGKVTKLVDDFHKRLRNNVKRRIAEEGVGFFSREEREAMGIDLYYKREDAGFDSLSEEEQNKVLEAPLKLMWNRIRALNDAHLEILLRAGRYSKEDIDRIKSHNWKYYVPLYGHDVVFENLSDPTEVYEFAYRGGSPSNNISFKKAEGRSSKAQDIFLNMYQLGQRCIAFEARNNAKRALLDFTRWTNNQLGAMGTRNLWYEKLSYQVKGEDGKWHSTDAIPSRDELAEMRKLNQQIGDYRLAVLNYNNRINSIEKLTVPSSQDVADKLDAELRGLQSKREEALRKIEELEEKKTWDVKRSNGFDAESPSTKDKVEADRTIKVWVDGREVRLVFNDPDVARAVNGTKVWAARGWAAKALRPIAWLTRARAQFNTQFSPDFIISNSLRDFQHALIAMALAEQEDVSISFMKNYVSHIASAFRSHVGIDIPIPSDVLEKHPIYYSYEQMRSAYLEALKSDPNITEEDFEQGYRDMVKANRVALEEKYGKQRVKDTLLEAFRAYGGATGFVHSLNEQAIQKQFREAMLLKNETIVRRYVNPISWARGLANIVSVASETMEDITRFATFLSHLDSGKSVEEAAQEAKEITTNFNRKGELSSGMGTLYMFFNASIQGSAQVMRLIKQHPRRAMAVMPLYAFLGFAQRITKGMLWKALAFWTIRGLLDDDDELRSIEQLESEVQIPDYIYGDNMIFTLYRTMDALDEVATSGYFLRIPQPNGFRAAYKLGVELGELALGQQSLAELPLSMASTVAGELLYGYNDSGEIGTDLGRMFVPSFAQPVVDLAMNRDFVNRTIYNERTYKPTAPTYTVAKKGTPQIYVEMSKALNSLLGTDTRSADYNKRWEKRQIRLDIPPEAFEYMVNEMFGGLGTFSNRLMTTVELMFKGEDVPLRKIPFVNRVAGEFEPKNVWPEYKALTDQVDLAWQETAAFRTEEGINMTRKEWKDPSVTYPYMIEHYKDDPNMVEMLRKRWLLKDYFKEVREYSDALKSLGEGGDAVDRASESREMTEQSEKLQADRTLTEKYILEVAKHVDWQAPTNEEVLEQLERVENTIFGD